MSSKLHGCVVPMQELKVNIIGVNTLDVDPEFMLETTKDIMYRNIQIQISCSTEREEELISKLKATGFVTDIKSIQQEDRGINLHESFLMIMI